MDYKEIRKKLEESKDKLSIFTDVEECKKFNISIKEFLDLISTFLNDDEKLKLFDCTHFQGFDINIKLRIIQLISNEDVLLNLLNNQAICKELKTNQILRIIKKMGDKGKKQVLYSSLTSQLNLSEYEIFEIIKSLSDDEKIKVLIDTDLITNKLKLSNYHLTMIIAELSNSNPRNIELKKAILLKNGKINKTHRINILCSLPNEDILDFFNKHRDIIEENSIHLYEIVKKLNIEDQIAFIARFEETDLTLAEKKQIIVVLNEETKNRIKSEQLSEDYRDAISIETSTNGWINSQNIDLERDLESYRGLDPLMRINPEGFNEEQRKKFIKLCEICPEMTILNTLDNFITFESSVQEYEEGEEWINALIESIPPEYSHLQKLAIVDHAIGNKISYSPDFDTEVFNNQDSRALWKIICTGYGVCNGLARIEQYILHRMGIESEMISSANHSFLKVKNIEIPLANGESIRGDTIVDPTWNLVFHKFGAMPDFFCINYEMARKNDINSKGEDEECHKNDEKLQDITISLDAETLREIFKSVNLTDKEGCFPIKELIELSKDIDEKYAQDLEKNLIQKFQLLKKYCPDFAKCQNSSMKILKLVLLNGENMNFNRCIINRVYRRDDAEKKPVMYVYIDSDEIGKRFYYADKEEGGFVELTPEEFAVKYECYDKDLEKTNRY